MAQNYTIRKTAAVERARIARMIRNSEIGWLFYPPGGKPVAISGDEAERLETMLLRQLDRFLIRIERMPHRMLIAGLAGVVWLTAVQIVASWLTPLALDVLIPALLAYTLWESLGGVRFRIDRRRWCRAEAERLRSSVPVPAPIAAHHRRYNLFQLASYALTLGGIARMTWLVVSSGDMARTYDPWSIALVVTGAVITFAADRIDATHLRRRWL